MSFFKGRKANKYYRMHCEMLFTKRIPNLALEGSSEEMGFEPRFKTFYSSTLTDSKREIIADHGSRGNKGAIPERSCISSSGLREEAVHIIRHGKMTQPVSAASSQGSISN